MSHYIYSSDGINAQGGLRANLPESLRDADKATRIAAGWYDYVSTAPEPTERETVICVGFVRMGEDFTGEYRVIPVPPAPVEPTRYSVRSIIRELKANGKFAAVRALLTAANYDWEFVGSNYLASDDPDFVRMCEAIVAQGIMTQAEIDEMLPKCLWEQTPMGDLQ